MSAEMGWIIGLFAAIYFVQIIIVCMNLIWERFEKKMDVILALLPFTLIFYFVKSALKAFWRLGR